ncbi:hypothetical protein SAMN04488029_0522 [Reichenbachiella faecimaris]|uniref:Uncharacterized protein n=1 Tax=Reichenbachiella faecimaris TaxID=692418 RepID=A0A1W2G685_REIFA|nr:hypothetical protein [Reichenbachiella faecimaris]SMD32180.1 hypothetical protein SAMN04488029_0522 [Reichenbachiella faecimaris]
MNSEITYQLVIDMEGVSLNGKTSDDCPAVTDLHQWLTALYQYLEVDYAKFHKMDHLCKLAFLGTEFLKKEVNLDRYEDDDIALVFQNSYSSLDTDQKHQANIDHQKASPAAFVYTLPNILLGEIAIRNRWYGENLFFLKEQFNLKEWIESSETLLQSKKAKVVIGGWAEVLGQHFELRLYMIQGGN